MHPGATLFFDCCVQEDCWPEGSWPLVRRSEAANVERMFALGRRLTIRQGGIVCQHGPHGTPMFAEAPAHCQDEAWWSARPPRCLPALPILTAGREGTDDSPGIDRTAAMYLPSGCAARPDVAVGHARAFAYLTAGVRDAVVFGAGIEHAMARAIEALLARRIRTHVALDASGAADETVAQLVVAGWKRRGVDVTTVAMVERMLL